MPKASKKLTPKKDQTPRLRMTVSCGIASPSLHFLKALLRMMLASKWAFQSGEGDSPVCLFTRLFFSCKNLIDSKAEMVSYLCVLDQ